MQHTMQLGIIADDFTGASDAASFAVKGGLQTVLFNGLPSTGDVPEGTDAVVIALKSRTQDTAGAVRNTLAALDCLRKLGAERIYDKYCSTFDSTPEGNIGPIADALMDALDVPYSIIAPSLPVNGRKVKNGELFVNGVPLAETHMRHHPLTPMTESDLKKLMDPQSAYPSFVYKENLPETAASRYYLIPDYTTDDEGAAIIRKFPDLKLYTGGSGLVEHLARHLVKNIQQNELRLPATDGRVLIVAGSMSVATQGQVQYYLDQRLGRAIKITPQQLAAGELDIDRILEEHKKDIPLLLYSSGSAGEGKTTKVKNAAELLEQFFATAAAKGVEHGFTNIISAGGETSGAVTQALNLESYKIGQSIAPGVPVMAPLSRPDIRVVLKSGNFGDEDFFEAAMKEVKNAR